MGSSQERRLAEQQQLGRDLGSNFQPDSHAARGTTRPASKLENRKIVVKTNLRELEATSRLKPSLLERAKAWWRNVADPQQASDATIHRENGQELERISGRIEGKERAALRQRTASGIHRTPRRNPRDFGRDAAGYLRPQYPERPDRTG